MILKIVKYPEPILSQPGEPVTEFNAELRKLVADMFETTYANQGVGLAAPICKDGGSTTAKPVFYYTADAAILDGLAVTLELR